MCDCIRNLYLILGNFNNGEQQNTSKQTKTHIHLKKTKYIPSLFVISCQNMQFYFLIFFFIYKGILLFTGVGTKYQPCTGWHIPHAAILLVHNHACLNWKMILYKINIMFVINTFIDYSNIFLHVTSLDF